MTFSRYVTNCINIILDIVQCPASQSWLYSILQVIVSMSTDTDNEQYKKTNNMYVIVVTNGQNQR